MSIKPHLPSLFLTAHLSSLKLPTSVNCGLITWLPDLSTKPQIVDVESTLEKAAKSFEKSLTFSASFNVNLISPFLSIAVGAVLSETTQAIPS